MTIRQDADTIISASLKAVLPDEAVAKALKGKDFGSGKGIGRQVTGYYDPTDPNLISENRPARPILSGGFFFIGAAICLTAAVVILNEEFYWFI